ncbi:MAG: SDR family oxidoreductase [Parvicellaceae bacterium]
MKILLTGATGYIGKRILPALIENGHQVICCVRDLQRFNPPSKIKDKIQTIQVDFLKEETLSNIPENIDGAYYLMHSMSNANDYETLELKSAKNFKNAINKTKAKHVIYLSGITNENKLSKHLNSRKAVEDELNKGNYNFTSLRAGIIIGSGSASFEIIRDLVEKLPVMVTPKWLETKCQPIAVRDVIDFLSKSLFNPLTYNQNFDIGCPDILSYKQMLLGYAAARGMRRKIFIVPVMTPRLSSYWLYFVTSTSYKLAIALVNSMKIEVICRNNQLNELLEIQPMSYQEALANTLKTIKKQEIISSWKDSLISGRLSINWSDFSEVPTFGCFKDHRNKDLNDINKTLDKIWAIGGKNGWYHANWLWRTRGFLDKLMGGVGLRRGRTNPNQLHVGDAVDFWRVLYANKSEGRLLLFAEMKLPGEAWLEFKIHNNKLFQTATFRPKGLWGRLYWFSILPLHGIVFKGMINKIGS